MTDKSSKYILALEKPEFWKRRGVKPVFIAGMIIITAILPLFIGASYMMHVLILTFIYIVAAVSFRAIIISGQFSIAHAAFMGIGAYVAGMASKWLNWPPWFTIPMGGIAAIMHVPQLRATGRA